MTGKQFLSSISINSVVFWSTEATLYVLEGIVLEASDFEVTSISGAK